MHVHWAGHSQHHPSSQTLQSSCTFFDKHHTVGAVTGSVEVDVKYLRAVADLGPAKG